MKVVVASSGPVDWLPDVAFVPLHPPLAVQDVAAVALHVSVALPPATTLVGTTLNDRVGVGCVTDTLTVFVTLPPSPVHTNVNDLNAFNGPVDSLPDVAFVPVHPPDAVQDVAFVDVQSNVEAPPAITDEGVAVSVNVGCGYVTVTVTLSDAVPP